MTDSERHAVIEHATEQARYARALAEEWMKVTEAFERVAHRRQQEMEHGTAVN